MKIKIVNHRKFRRRIILIVFIICCILFNIKNIALSQAKITYNTITVCEGDTLWSIAKEQQQENKYYANTDIREVVSNIKEINKLESSSLKVNQQLQIPTI